MKAGFRRYFPRTAKGGEIVLRISSCFAQNRFCGQELYEIEDAIAEAVDDAVRDGTGDVIVLKCDANRDGMFVQLYDRGGQGFLRIYRRFSQVKAMQEA